jgi:hypothetical protein
VLYLRCPTSLRWRNLVNTDSRIVSVIDSLFFQLFGISDILISWCSNSNDVCCAIVILFRF